MDWSGCAFAAALGPPPLEPPVGLSQQLLLYLWWMCLQKYLRVGWQVHSCTLPWHRCCPDRCCSRSGCVCRRWIIFGRVDAADACDWMLDQDGNSSMTRAADQQLEANLEYFGWERQNVFMLDNRDTKTHTHTLIPQTTNLDPIQTPWDDWKSRVLSAGCGDNLFSLLPGNSKAVIAPLNHALQWPQGVLARRSLFCKTKDQLFLCPAELEGNSKLLHKTYWNTSWLRSLRPKW